MRGALVVLLLLTACSESAESALVPITVIGERDSSRLTVSASTGDCPNATTEVIVEERGPDEVAVAVRFAAGNICTYGGFFDDIEVQLDGPLGDRSLLLIQPVDYATTVGSDVCIIDGEQQSPRCTVEIGAD